jgi:hypothetical protein
MKSQIDLEFRGAITRLAAERSNYLRDNRDVTHFFNAIVEKHPLFDFRAYIKAYYLLERWDHIVGNYEVAELYYDELTKLDPRFQRGDRLMLSFQFGSTRSEIVAFLSSLSQPGII